MTITHIVPGLFQLVIPTPFPVGPVNVYLAFDADGPLTLIDTGPCTDEARTALERNLNALGYTFSDIQRIIISHGHTDHYGLAGDIVQISGSQVYSHSHNHSLLEDQTAERERRRDFYRDVLGKAGVPRDLQARFTAMLQGYRHFGARVSPVQALEEGETVWLAGQWWQVLFMPGHAGGLICLYQPETGLFLSNDHLLRDISSNPFFEPPLPGQTRKRRSLVDYVASLERTAALDIAVAWPGHGEPIHDHRALIEERLAFHRRRADRILATLNVGVQTVYAVSQAVFSDLKPLDRFLAISEVLAHLEWLEDQGVVTSQMQDGLVLWRRSDG